MDEMIRQAFSEVYDVIEHMENELIKKIPHGFIKLIQENRDMRLYS